MGLSRRDFIKFSTVAAAAGAQATSETVAQALPIRVAQAALPAPHGFDPADPMLKYDLVIGGGEVLDPSQKLRGKRDIGIKNAQIAAVAPSIPADRALKWVDAGGKLVTPGLVDLHTHFCPDISGIGLPPDELVGITGVTTAVSAGDSGWSTFGAFRRWVTPQCRTRSSPSSTSPASA